MLFRSINGLSLSTDLLLQATYLSTALDLGTVQNTNQTVTAPSIVSQPTSQTIVNGQTANFAVTVAGTRPVAYQWLFNGTNLAGATSATLTLVNVQTNNSGNYLVVVTNSGGAATSSVATLTVRPVADLVVRDITNPTNALSGQPFTISWRSLNQGLQSALSPWTEAVALSTNVSGTPQIPVASFVYHTDLAGGQSIVRTQSVIAPGGLDGTFYVVITTDTANQVPEEANETNNTTVSSTALVLRSPDLQPLALSTSPGSAQFGQTIPFSWVTTNSGSGPAQSTWTDRVYLSAASNSLSGATSLASLLVTNVPLAQNSAVSNSASLAIPLTASSSNGTYFLVVSADDDNGIAESRETNNLASRAITLSLPPLPDLAVAEVQAPTQALAGVAVTLRWTTTNAGTAGLSSQAWTESVVVSNASAILTLAEFRFTNTIPVGGSLSRTQDVVFPSSLPAGDYSVRIAADSLQEIVEGSDANNSGLATNTTTLPGQLTLMLPFGQVNEGEPPFLATISRNGSFAGALAVNLSNSPAGNLAMTNLVIIPAGQLSATFSVQPLADGVPDPDQLVTISASATNYVGDAVGILVRNVDQPPLTLSLSPAMVSEGLFATGTVSRAFSTNVAVTVALASSAPSQVVMPATVVIPSNQLSASFAIQSVDETQVTGNHTNIITASASGFVAASAGLGIIDNDLPTVVLTLAQSTVSEGAGPSATMATVTRTPVTSQALVLDLTSSAPGSAQVPTPVVIPANTASYSFPVAAINNNLLDGDRVATLRVFIRATGTTIDIAEGTGANLTVTDDDGPTLRIDLPHDVAAEGLNPAMTGTVTRNTSTASSLLVSLNSSRTDKATVPASVTIPSGAASAPFDIVTLTNGIVDGNQTVVLTASAGGFASGSKALVVSDINLPDLVVSQLTAPTNAYTDTYMAVNYRLENQGLAGSGTNLVTRFYLSTNPIVGDDTLLGEATVAGPLGSGQFFNQVLQFRLPSAAGQYWVIAKTDPDNHVSELREDNNTTVTAAPIVVQSAYTATVQASVLTALIPTNVTLTGTATLRAGGPAQYVPVSLHIFVRGTERVIQAITDSSGHYSTVFHPLPNEAGDYLVGAAHPGDATAPAQAAFTLLGMRTEPASALLVVISGSSNTGAVSVVNLGDTALTGLTPSVVSAPGNLNVSFNLGTNQVGGQQAVTLGYTVSATDASQPQGIAQLRVTSAEGAKADYTLFVAVWPTHSQLATDPSSLKAAMAIGGQQRVQFSIVNRGGLASGPVTLSIPSAPWLSVASANPIPSLAPGASNVVTLLLTPAADLTLGHYTGNIVAVAADSFATIPFDFTAMSVARGDLTVAAVDEFTFYAAGAPRVANAQVVITDHETQIVLTNGLTDTNGFFSVAQIPEAYYDIAVTASNHFDYQGGVLVHGGITNNLEAFLSRQLVQYTWTVVPTTIEDRTRITIETTFETAVPAPVVTLSPAVVDLADVQSNLSQVSLIISNHGLVAARDLMLIPPRPADWRITPLVTNLGTLTANGSFTVPVVIERLSTNGDDCAFALTAVWTLPVGSSGTNHYADSMRFINAGHCPVYVGGGGGGGGGGGSGGGGGGGGIGTNDFGEEILPVWPLIPSTPLPGNPFVSQPIYPTPSDIIAKVRVRINQDLVLTRNAFKATLELENQSSTLSLSNIQITLNITDTNGQPANDIFGINSPTLAHLNSVDGTGILATNSTGSASWTIIPTRSAAPETPVVYGVGGVLKYTQNGVSVAIPLFSAPITVYPDPALYVKYFHQRDVFADDPFTDAIEPSIPYLLGVMVENRGKGDAKNVRIISGQPQIVDNELGLLIDFKIIGTKVEGQDQTPSLTATFGDIAPGERGIGLWFLTSTLQGFFSDYSATFQHVDDLGKTNLSLVDEVTIHELTHLVQAPGPFADGMTDFLVNDTPDADNLPDRVYLSDGTTNPVVAITQAATDGPASGGHLTVHLSAATPNGFVYLRVPDPGNGQFKLVSVVRSDSVTLSLDDNVWTTDRTFVPGHRPIYENKLHLFDYNTTGNYTLTYQVLPPPDTTPPASSVAALPASSYEGINLTWSGGDEAGGSGLAFFDIYASVDGGPFQPWLPHSTLTGSLYPGQFGHSYAFYSLATDSAGNRESPPSVADAQTFVSLTNSPPVIPAATNITVDEGDTLSLALPASDTDPGQTLSFSGMGLPPHANLSPATGLITWPTLEADGPGTNVFKVIVSDNGQPALSATGLVTVVVREVNQPPTFLEEVPDFTINEGVPLTVTNRASDADVPANVLMFSLGSGSPVGAAINPASGVFTWQPNSTQGPSTNIIAVVVTDNGVPPLSATQQFVVIVRDTLSDVTLNVGSTNLLAGEGGSVALVLKASLALTNFSFHLSAPFSRLTNLALVPLSAEVTAAGVSASGPDAYILNLDLDPDQQTSSERPVARLDFLAVSNGQSAIVSLGATQLLAHQSSGALVANGAATSGRVIIVARQPVLDLAAGLPPQLTFYGLPGTSYSLQSSTDLSGTWGTLSSFTLSNRFTTLSLTNTPPPAAFYRAREN